LYLSLADHYVRAKDSTKAKEALSRGLAALPGNTDLQQALTTIK
jgi:hypothetical protein